MDPVSTGELQCRVGDEVFDAAGHKVGKVVAFDSRVLTVEHGMLRKGDYYIPISAVNACNDGQVYLAVAKEHIESQGWDVPPMVATEADGVPVNR